MTATVNVTQIRPRTEAANGVERFVESNRRTTLRLTKRGRAVFGALATVLVAATFGVVAGFAAPGAVANISESVQEFPYVLPQAGDSLWSLASELDPAADPREVVAEIVRLNQLQNSDLRAGEAIAVPLRFEGNELTFPASDL